MFSRMPPIRSSSPSRLEDQCLQVYLNYLHDEVHLLFYLKNFHNRSVLLSKHGLAPEKLYKILQDQLSHSLTGILHDIVRQKMLDILISRMSNLFSNIEDMLKVGRPPEPLYSTTSQKSDSSQKSYSIASQVRGNMENEIIFNILFRDVEGICRPGLSGEQRLFSQPGSPRKGAKPNLCQYRNLPVFQLFELILHREMRVIDFSQNKQLVESDLMNDVAKTLWKIVSEKCHNLSKFIVPKELSYCSTMDGIILSGQHLTHLTLKRNVPNNFFLAKVGQNCPNLQELDIAGADIVTDFGVVCLLFSDPEQIFMECWNREKTVGSVRRAVRSFPHPHFDKPIPDPTEVPQGNKRDSPQFLHLKKTFHEAVRDPQYEWELLPISTSLLKLRLENTKVKGDGASVVLECCPNLYSLGYLVFAAAGLKQVYGYEEEHETKFTEIFYRGPSDQKLQTISNCCRKLRTMFLGSNNIRRLNHSVFSRWKNLEYLTLENIIHEDVPNCLKVIGHQLKGLKIQCVGFDLTNVAIYCPNLESLIIQKERPNPSVDPSRVKGMPSTSLLGSLKHLEVTCTEFPIACFSFIAKLGLNLQSIKVMGLSAVSENTVEDWIAAKCFPKVHTFILFQGRDVTYKMVEILIEMMPNLRKFGDLNSFDSESSTRNQDMKRLVSRIKEEQWDLMLIDSSPENVPPCDKDFSKMLSLHWFYLTEAPTNKKSY